MSGVGDVNGVVLVSPSSHTTLHLGYYVVDLPLPRCREPFLDLPAPMGIGANSKLGGEISCWRSS